MRDEKDKVLSGSVEDLESHVDDGRWIETIEGARFPREVLALSDLLDDGRVWKNTSSTLRGQEEFEKDITREGEGGSIEQANLATDPYWGAFGSYIDTLEPFPYSKILQRHVYTAEGFVMEAH